MKNSTEKKVEESLAVKACLRLYFASEPGSRLRKEKVEELAKLAVTFGDWAAILYSCPELEDVARKTLSEFELSSEEWQVAYQESRSNSEVESILHQLSERITRKTWLDIYRMSDSGTKLEKFAKAAIEELEKTEQNDIS